MRVFIFGMVLVLLGCGESFAQHRQSQKIVFRRFDDHHKIAFGYFVMVQAVRYHLNFTEEYADNRFNSIVSSTRSGFSLGFNGAYRFDPLWELTVQPLVSFTEFGFAVAGGVSSVSRQAQVQSHVGMPIMVSYKSVRRGNFRMFMNAGVTPELNPMRKNPKELVELSKYDVKLNIGFGLTRYYPLFNFSPELRFSYGLINQFVDVDHDLSKDISSMYSRSVSLLFNIGG